MGAAFVYSDQSIFSMASSAFDQFVQAGHSAPSPAKPFRILGPVSTVRPTNPMGCALAFRRNHICPGLADEVLLHFVPAF